MEHERVAISVLGPLSCTVDTLLWGVSDYL